MKVKVKTLRGIQFEVEAKLEDTVADLKKNIESVKGADVYPAARQMLIYRSKVLKDDTTLEEYEVVDYDFMVIMLSPLNRVAPPPPPPPSSTTNPDIPSDNLNDDQEATRLAEGINLLAGVINRIVEEGGGRWDMETAVDALRDVLNNDPELNSGVPESSDLDPPVTEAPPPPAVTPPPATPPPPSDPPTGPNTNPLNLFPQDLRPGAEYGIHDQMSPGEMEGFREEALAASAELFPITREDDAALERLEAMGFSRLLVWEAYLECNKNEEQAVNYLREHWPPDSEK